MARCAAIKANSERCKVDAMPDSDRCWSHAPEMAEERRRRASKGGKRGGRGRPQVELAGLKGRLSTLADDVLAGNVDRGNAAVAAQVLNVYLRAVALELKVREVEDLGRRLEELEDVLQDQKGGRYGA